MSQVTLNNPFPMLDFKIKNQTLPDKVILPIFTNKPCVKIGDKVLVGQVLTTGTPYTHASISGKISNISDEFIPHKSKLKVPSITIVSDNEDKWIKLKKVDNFLLLSPKEIIEKLEISGIIGLGGAGFVTSVKIKNKKFNTIIINACECEPAIECDNALMQEYPHEILCGIDILLHITGAKKAIIVIENDKTTAFKTLATFKNNHKVELQFTSTFYGSGSEKTLINNLLGLKIASRKFASDYGVLMQNVATVKAIFDFIVNGIPLIERVVTVIKNNNPQNLKIRIGTIINNIITKPSIVNGLMMGINLENNNYPILKITNSIFEYKPSKKIILECIRCGDCAKVCPSGLLPQQIYWFAKNGNIQKSLDYNVIDCTHCRLCEEVCGSNIPLSDYFYFIKSKNLLAQQEAKEAKIASERFLFREYRLERNKKERAEMMARKRKEIKIKIEKKQNATD